MQAKTSNLSSQTQTKTKSKSKFYGLLVKIIKFLCNLVTKKYECNIVEKEEPCVYVCRHLNMFGPIVTLKSFAFDVHPLILSVFFSKESTEEHFRKVTFSKNGKKNNKFSVKIKFFSYIVPKIVKSIKGVPVYRNANPIKTLKVSVDYLLKGESLIVYPDINYKAGYDEVSNIYDGFLVLSRLYKKRTGKDLKFIPLIIDKKNKKIVERQEVVIYHYNNEFLDKKLELIDKINLKKITDYK